MPLTACALNRKGFCHNLPCACTSHTEGANKDGRETGAEKLSEYQSLKVERLPCLVRYEDSRCTTGCSGSISLVDNDGIA